MTVSCSRKSCANACMIVDQEEPRDGQICCDCWIGDEARKILEKALGQVYELGFDVQFVETEASGLPVTMETVELERARLPCPYVNMPLGAVPGHEEGHCCPVCKLFKGHGYVPKVIREEYDLALKENEL